MSEDTRSKIERNVEASSWVALFFPEAIPAAIIVLTTPAWVSSLISNGQIGAAALLGFGVLASTAASFWFLRKKQKWGAWAAMIGLFLLAYFVHSLTP